VTEVFEAANAELTESRLRFHRGALSRTADARRFLVGDDGELLQLLVLKWDRDYLLRVLQKAIADSKIVAADIAAYEKEILADVLEGR